MQLIEFILKKRMTRKEFSTEAGISEPTVYRILEGKNVSYSTARKVESYTEKEVTVEELIKMK